MTTITQGNGAGAAPGRDWSGARLGELIDHITNTHHAFMRTHLPKVQAIFDKILAKQSGDICGFVHPLSQTFFSLRAELENHLMKEEQILFPQVVSLEEAREAGNPPPSFHCGTVQGPISMMEHEHANAKKALDEMRRLTNGYPAEEDMCPNRRTLFEALMELEADLDQHIHLENDFLFPRAIKLE